MTVKEINAAFGERAGELKNPAKRVGLIDMGLIHLFMMCDDEHEGREGPGTEGRGSETGRTRIDRKTS